MAQNSQVNVGIKFRSDTKEVENSLNKLKQSLQDLQKIKLSDFKGNAKDFDQMQQTAKKVQIALEKAFNPTLNTTNIKTFQSELQKTVGSVDQVYNKLKLAGPQGEVAFHQMATEVLTTNLKLKETNSLIDSMGKTMINTVKWGIASSVMNTFTQSVQGAFQYVQSLERSLTNIRIVTGDSTEKMAQFAEQANRSAQALGRSTLDYTKASLTFYQQGLSDEDVQTRTEATLKAQNITGAGQQMADYLTSVWNGYKVANEEAEVYVDKLAAVADSSASDMSELAIAMSKVASTANTLGVDVDQLNAQIATVVATTRQAPESVGTAFKTIYSRMNDIKTGSDEAEISLGNYSGKMAELGFNVLDATGHLRDTGQVMEEIGGRWQDLTKEQQIYLAQTMGGQRQVNQLMALFDNWTTYSELLNTSLESEGTLAEKNARYMESLGAKMEQLGAAGERVKDALINENELKGGVQALTNLVNLMGNFIESIGGGSTALLAFGSLATQVFQDTIARQINNIISNIQDRKNNDLIKQQDIEKTELFGKSEGYDQGVITKLVDNKKAIQDYYNIMSQGEINAYNNIIKTVAAQEQQTVALQKSKDAGEQFKSYLAQIPGVAKQLQKDLGSTAETFSMKAREAGEVITQNWSFKKIRQDSEGFVQSITTAFDDLGKSFGGMQAFQNMNSFKGFKQAYNDIMYLQDGIEPTQEQLETLFTTWRNFTKELTIQTGNVAILDEINSKLELSKAKLQAATNEAENFRSKIQQLAMVRSFVGFVSGLGQIASGIKSIINLNKIWQNENLSTGQKLLQTFTNLSMTIGLFANGFSKSIDGFNRLKKAARELQTIVENFATARKIAAAEEAGAVNLQLLSQEELQAAYAETGVKAWLSLGPYAAIVIGIAAAIGLVIAAYKDWNKEAEAAEQASKNAVEAKKHYDNLKTSLDNIKTALDNLHTAEDNLDSLTKGTQEWRDALQQVNNQVLDLIAEYPELTKYVENNNGQLSISKKGEEEYLKNLQEGVQIARNASYVANSRSREANINAAAAAIGHQSSYGNGTAGQGGGFSTAEDVKNVALAVDKFVGEGKDISGGLNSLSGIIAEQTHMTQQQVSAILSNETALNQLRVQLQENATADKLMYQTMAQSKLEDNLTYKGMSDLGKQIANNLGGQALNSEIKARADELLQQYRGIARWDNNNVVVTGILDKLNQIQGTQWTLDSNAVQGGGEGRTFHFLNGSEQISLNAKNVAQMIATAQALEKLGTSAENTSNILSAINKSNESEGAKTGVQQFLAGDNINLKESELEGLSGETLQNIFGENITQVAKDAGYESAEAFKQAFEEDINYAREEFASIGENAFSPVKQQLEESLSDGDYLLNTQKNLEAIFSNIFEQSGSDAMESFENIKDVLMETKDLSQEEKESILSLFANADLSTPKGLNELEESLRQLGAQTILASEDWIKFKGEIQDSQFVNPVDTIFDQQASINNITGNLKKGSVISEEDLETLAALDSGVRDFFKRTAEGYELIGNKGSLLKLLAGSTPDYLEAANNLDSLITKAEELQNIVGENLNTEDLKDTELQNYSSLLMDSLGGNKEAYAALGTNQEYIQSVKQELDDLMATETDERDEKWQAEYDERIAILKEFVSNAQQLPDTIHRSTEELRSAAALNAKSLSELNSMLMEREKDPQGKAGINGQQFGAALQTVSKREMEDLGFDPEVYENYVDLLQATNKEYAENEYLARQVANANMRISQGTQDLIDNWKDWNKVFQDYLASDRDVSVLAEKWGQFKDTLANLFDMDAESFDLLGPNFVADNLDKIEAVKDGIPGAYEDLESLIEDELWGRLEDAVENSGKELKITAGMDINKGEIYTTSQQLFNQLQAISDNANIEVGTNVDDTNLIAGLNNMIDASNMASDEMAAIFDAMGYDVEFQEKPDAIHQKSENVEYYVPPTYKMENLGNASLGFAGLSLPVNVPVIDQPGRYDSTKGEKETYEPGTYAIKTITKNGKGSGGKISRKTAGAPSNKGSGKGGGGKKGGGGGGGKAKEPNKAKGATNKADRYRNNTVKANKLANQMTKLNKQQERLTGKDALKNLQKQLEILEKQKEVIKERLGLQRDEQNELANNLKKYGATFDKDGTLNNYFTTHDKILKEYNDKVAEWNQMTAEQQESNKDYLNNAKEIMDQAFKDLERYDKLQQEIAKTQQEQIDKTQEQIDLKVKQLDLKIKAELDLSKAKRDWNKFQKDIVNEIRDDDILGLNKFRFADIASYYNNAGTGSIQNLTDRLKEVMGDKNGIFSGSYFTQQLAKMSITDRAAQLEKVKEIFDDLQDQMEGFKEIADEIKESIFDAIDAAQDAFDEQMDEYEYLGDLIDHNMKITEMFFGDEAYDQMAKFYDRIEENNNAQLDFLAKQKDLWYSRMAEEQARMNQLAQTQGTDSNLYKEARDRFEEYKKHWMDTVKDLNSTVEDALDNIMDKYNNAINKILVNFELKLGDGHTLDDIEDEWDILNDQADRYFDKINAAYEIDKLENAFNDAINDNDGDIAAQQSLNDLMEQQLAYLRDKQRLTQYDVDRANALLQIEMKRLALEQSRSNKNRLRLRRDSQGNYTYQYTADTEAISKAEQELADAQNSLYNSDKAAYVDNLSDIQKSAENIKNKLEDIWTDENLSKEQKLQKSYELEKYYGDQINKLLEDNANIRNNLIQSSTEELAKIYGINIEQFQALSDTEQTNILKDLIPQAGSYLSKMTEGLIGDGGIGKLFEDSINRFLQAEDERINSIAEIERNGQINFEDIINDTNTVIGQAEQLLDNNEALINSYEQELNAVQNTINGVNDLIQTYERAKQAAIQAATAANNFINQENVELIGSSLSREAAAQKANDNVLNSWVANGNSYGDLQNYTPYEPNWHSSDFAAIFGSSNVGLADLAAYQEALQNTGSTTGNITGQSEYTPINVNSILDTIQSNVSHINDILEALHTESSNYYTNALNKAKDIERAIIANQTVHIDADFPNARDVSNIIDAINNLTLVAAQKAGKI